MNVEIPSLSVSDMRRLKATNHVGTYTLFQETYHRPTFKVREEKGPLAGQEWRERGARRWWTAVLTKVKSLSGV